MYNKPLTVLRQEGEYSFVQYVLNPGNDGTYNVKFERGWVKTSELTLDPKTSAVTSPSSATKYYIKNVATGLYLDVSGYTSADGTRIQLWDFHGGYNQEFILQPITTTHGSTYVRLLTNMAAANNKAVRVATGAAIMNSNVDLHTVSNLRSQEFYFQPTLDGHYYIRSRCGQNYMMLGVDPNNSGTGSNVLLRYPTSSLYNKWDVEPAYEEGTDFVYKPSEGYNGVTSPSCIDSTVTDGITAKYNISSVSRNAAVNGQMLNFTNLTNESLNSWLFEKVTLQPDSTSKNKIIWKQTGGWNYINPKDSNFGESYFTYTFDRETGALKEKYVTIGIFIDTVYNYSRDYKTFNDFPDIWKSALAHELGHSLGLDENFDTNTDSLMCQHRDRTIVVTPQKMDLSGVKKNYSPQK